MSKKLFAILLLLGMCFSLVWAGGIAVNSTGARAVGLGTAFRGVADDWSTLYWNPAGIAQVGRQVGLNASFIIPSTSVTPALFDGHAYQGYTTKKADAEGKTFIIPAFGYVHPLNDKITLGLGVFAPFGLGVAWDLYNLPPGGGSGFPAKDFESLISVIEIQPTIAYKVNNKLMFGLGIGITINEINLKQVEVVDPFDGKKTPFNNAPNDLLSGHISFQNAKGTSWGFNLGTLYKMNEKWTFGASMRYYADLKLKGKAALDLWTFNDPATVAAINGAAALGLITAAEAAQLSLIYGSGTNGSGIIREESDGTGTIPLPMSIGAGVGYHPNSKWLWTAEIEWTQWSKWSKLPLKFDTQGNFLTDTDLIEEWKDSIRWGIGAEYLAISNENMKLFLRGAFQFDQSPIPDKSLTANISEINNHNSAFLGASLHRGQYVVDFNLENIFFADRNVTTWTASNVAGKYSQNVFAYHLSLGYHLK